MVAQLLHPWGSMKQATKRRGEPRIIVEPAKAARAAGLRYISDDIPGIRRQLVGDDWVYLNVDGAPLTDEAELQRIRSLAIPPAYEEVWISPIPKGHLQATGRDAKGRKQYRYHPKWREVRDETKYGRMLQFGAALPRIRARVAQDLALRGLPRNKVLAAVVRLLETTFIRVGNDEYARTNKSFGLTTLRDRHVAIEGATMEFSFRGKSGVKHAISVKDRRLARIVQQCRDLPGQELFQFVDDDGVVQDVRSDDVNAYLHEISGDDYTAKDFRTWAGTVLAALALQALEIGGSETQAKKNVVQAVQQVAERLGNTPSVCRKCYIHPAVIEAYLTGSVISTIEQRIEEALDDHDLSPEEAAVMRLLQAKLS